jgi:hypothetical protein
MDVKRKIVANGFTANLKFYRGMRRIVRKKGTYKLSTIQAWAKFMADQSRMHKMFSDEPYEFHGIPKR